MIGKIIKVILPAIILSCFFYIGEVYATFNFDYSKPYEENNNLYAEITEFKYFFPTTEEGIKNEELVYNLINGIDGRAGLNTSGSSLNILINSRKEAPYYEQLGSTELIGNMDVWAADTLNEFLLDNQDMTFIIYFPESEPDTYYIFTTCASLVDGEIIGPIYRTKLNKKVGVDGKTIIFEIVEVQAGSAPCGYVYYNVQWYATKYSLSFDIYQWEILPQ